MKIFATLIMFVILAMFSTMAGEKVETPAKLKGASIVDVGQVEQLMKQGVPIIDVRKKIEYNSERIKGAHFLPYKANKKLSKLVKNFDGNKDRFDIKKLLKIAKDKKSNPIIMYCNGLFCWQSYKSSKHAIAQGFTKVYWFQGGLPNWKKAGKPTEGSDK